MVFNSRLDSMEEKCISTNLRIEKDCGVKGGECVNSWKNDPEETLVMQKKEMSGSVIFIRKW